MNEHKKRARTQADKVRARQVNKILLILGEANAPMAEAGVHRAIKRYGIEQVKVWLREAKRIQDRGGMLTDKGNRMRTFGGVFFHLVKRDAAKFTTLAEIDTLGGEEAE